MLEKNKKQNLKQSKEIDRTLTKDNKQKELTLQEQLESFANIVVDIYLENFSAYEKKSIRTA